MNELQDFEHVKLQYEKEELHDVFRIVLDTFSAIGKPTVQGQIYLWEHLQKIKCNFLIGIDVETYLIPKYINRIRNKEYDESKIQLPAICYNASFKGYRDLKHLKSINNIMFLDIDDFSSKEDTLAYKSKIIEKFDWIIACNLSLSRLGLHIIIMVDRIVDNNDYNFKYDYISKTYFDNRLDPISKSLSRCTIVPCDYNIYINESPNRLDIDNIITNNKISISSVYNEENSNSSNIIGDSTFSVYNNDNSSSSIYIQDNSTSSSYDLKKKIICTPYTFSPDAPLKEVMNYTARKNGLRFKMCIDESFFTSPNTPLYYEEGVDVISINLCPYRNRKVYEGHRTTFVGALSAQLIYLNMDNPKSINQSIKEQITKFILKVNKKICEPPLSTKEVLNSINANLKKYMNEELDFSRYFHKQYAFWSNKSTLTANEKRMVTCHIKNEPIVNDTKRRIREAVEAIQSIGAKVTQPMVAKVSLLGLSTVKKYRIYYNELVQGSSISSNIVMDIPVLTETSTTTNPDAKNNKLIQEEDFSDPDFDYIDVSDFNSINDFKIKNRDISSLEPEVFAEEPETKQELSKEETLNIFHRIYSSIIDRFSENQVQELKTRFHIQIHSMPHEDVKLLVTPIDDISDSSAFFRQSMLEGQFWSLCNDLN